MPWGFAVGNWAKDLKAVKVPMGETPKRVTLVLPFYQNHGFLEQQIAVWRAYPSDVRESLSVIVVDDGSPQPAQGRSDVPFLRLFRIEQDVRWNWLAARNIGAHHAAPGWLLLTDMDHVVPTETLRALMHGSHDPSTVYVFHRREHTGEIVKPHSASFFLTRELFWTIGGYDEALSGHYGTDGVWRAEVSKHAPMRLLPEHLVRYEYVGDSSTTAYQRKQPEDAAVRRLVAQRGKGWRPTTLSFPYHEVTA